MLVNEQSIYTGSVISDNNGEASFTYTGTNAGSVDIILEYFDEKAELTIEDGNGKTNTNIQLTEPVGKYTVGDVVNVSGVLLDEDGEPLANKTIKIDTEEVE
jgi:F0F1-type ATP synthase beta subunit